jgi:hypothetical protein
MNVFGFSSSEGLSLTIGWGGVGAATCCSGPQIDPCDELPPGSDTPMLRITAPPPRHTDWRDLLQRGENFDRWSANELVRRSHGRLTWAKDGDDDWWIVTPEDKGCVENAKCGYRGSGLRFGPADGSRWSSTPVNRSEMDYISDAWSPLADNCGDGRVHLRPGHPYTMALAQRLVNDSRGALVWAEDGRGDWWIVPRRDQDEVETARLAGAPYLGKGVRALDSSLQGYPITPGDAQAINRAASPLVGDSPHAMIRLRPGADQWDLDLAQRIADVSGGKLCLVQDRDDNQYLIASRDKAWFDHTMRQPDEGVHVCDRHRRHHERPVQRDQLDWIASIMG